MSDSKSSAFAAESASLAFDSGDGGDPAARRSTRTTRISAGSTICAPRIDFETGDAHMVGAGPAGRIRREFKCTLFVRFGTLIGRTPGRGIRGRLSPYHAYC